MLPGISVAVGLLDKGGGLSGSFDANASPGSISRTASTTGGPRTVTTGNVVVTPSGGSGTYSFTWSRISGDAAITATVPSGPVTAFSATIGPSIEVEATFACLVTDTVSGATKSVFVDVDLYLIGPGT